MLVRFIVSNFLSLGEETEFNMLTGNYKNHKQHIYKFKKLELLKAAAIYGANGAGKSNLVKALDFLRDLVLDGELYQPINSKKFKLNKLNNDKPVKFAIEFISENKSYEYGLVINSIAVQEEWLYETKVNGEDKIIFNRKKGKNKAKIIFGHDLVKTQKSKLLVELLEEQLLKDNELLITKAKDLNISAVHKAFRWFDDSLRIIFPGFKPVHILPNLTYSKLFQSFTSEILKTFDTGIDLVTTESIKIEDYFGEDDKKERERLVAMLIDGDGDSFVYDTDSEQVFLFMDEGVPKVNRMILIHKNSEGEEVKFNLSEESDGTQRILDFIPAIEMILNYPVTIIIDEIDQSLHVSLLKALLSKIMAEKETKGQIIFTTHESNLLDLNIFRQDEIWFAEKDKKGSTHYYSLGDFNPRYDLDIKKGYLQGRFGAIPFLGNFEDLNWNSYVKDKQII